MNPQAKTHTLLQPGGTASFYDFLFYPKKATYMYMNKLLAQLDTSSGYNNDEGFSRREFENSLSAVFSKGVSYF